MVNQAAPINPGFSTADASYPEIRLANSTLRLAFNDWQKRSVQVEFSEVCAFRWQEAEVLLPGEPYDGAIEVLHSEWLAQHFEQGAIPRGSKHRHLRFNFNACGQLEVLCVSFSIGA